jgi:hypothetical protein
MSTSAVTKAIVATAALAGVSAGVYMWISKRVAVPALRTQEVAVLPREQLIVLLKDLLTQFHGYFIEMSNMVQRLAKLGALRGPNGPMNPAEIADFLMQQGMQAKLDAAQTAVLAKHGVSQSQIQATQSHYADDDEIADLITGFSSMFEDASRGIPPILPGLSIPEDLTEDKALAILAEINHARAEGFRRALAVFWESDEAKSMTDSTDVSRGPPPALAQALQSVHDEAELLVMERHAHIVGSKAVFDSAVALFTRSSDNGFGKERLRMERSHQVEIVNLMRKKDSRDSPKLEPIDGLNPRLICSDEGDMAHQILEAAEHRKPVVTALVRNIAEAKNRLEPISNAIDDGRLAELVGRDAVFLYMPAHNDIPIANRPEYKDVEVCYIFFPRPDKQERPIACFSLEELIEASTIDPTIYEGAGAAVFDNVDATD